MKKFLSLVLALIMTMSLVTVSAGAKDFTDDDKITYEEAVAVMSEVKVLDGYTDGSFKPQGELTRGAAAKIICNLILGPTTAAELHADTVPYKDVPTDHTFAGYIAYCAKEGIISGYADGTFRPAAPLTGYAFMKMLLGALGYDQITEGYTGANWSINVAKQALGIGLNKGLEGDFSGIKSVTREEAALYAFNTLKATMVEYTQKTTVTVGGAEVVLAGNAQDVEWGVATLNDGNIKKDGFVQFGEKHFPKLVRTPDVDNFGRPSSTWTFNKKDIGTYVNYDLLVAEYTTGVKGGKVFNDIGSVASKFDLTYWQDGKTMSKTDAATQAGYLKKGNDDTMGDSGNGVLTQVFVDTDTEDTTIVEINTYLAKVAADYNTKKETLSVTVYGYAGVSKIYLEDVPGIEDYKADDYILVNIADDVIVNVIDPETIEDTAITKFAVSSSKPKYVVAGGDQIDSAETLTMFPVGEAGLDAYNKDALEDYTYNIYVDQYGYVIGIERVTGTAKYLFLVGYDKPSSNLTTSTANAAVIFTDGKMEEVKVAFKKTNENIAKGQGAPLVVEGESHRNQWFKYTEDKGVYTLTDIDNTVTVPMSGANAKTRINCQSVRVVEGQKVAYGNDDSVYITVKAEASATDINGEVDITKGDAITKVNNVYTGVQDIDLKLVTTPVGISDGDVDGIEDNIYVVYDTDKYIIAAVVLGEDDSKSTGYAYAIEGAQNEYFSDGYYYWDFKAVVDGVVETLTIKSKYTDVIDEISAVVGKDNVGKPALIKLTYDAANEYVIDADLLNSNADDDNVYSGVDFNKSEDIDPTIFKTYQVTFGNAWALTCSGRTLYTGKTSADVGLTMVTGAPIVVVQKTAAGKLSVEEYSTIKAALDALEDSSAFKGTIAAKLNDKGTAEWLVLDSSVQLTEDNKAESSNPSLAQAIDIKLYNASKKIVVEVDEEKLPAYDDEYEFIEDLAALIENELIARGYTVQYVDEDFEYVVVAKDGVSEIYFDLDITGLD